MIRIYKSDPQETANASQNSISFSQLIWQRSTYTIQQLYSWQTSKHLGDIKVSREKMYCAVKSQLNNQKPVKPYLSDLALHLCCP